MPLDFRYEATNNANLTSLGSNGVRFGEVSLTQAAEVGQPAISTLDFDDDAGTLDIVGWRQFLATESAAASNSQLIGKFRVASRVYSRGLSQRTTVARKVKVDLLDYNSQLGLRLFVDSDANRPAETASDRLTWVLSTRPNTLYAHPTLCSAPATAMDACDYRQQRYNDVLADIANTTGYNFWCAFDEGRSRSEIFFMNPDSSSYASTIAISNDLAAINGTTVFAMSEDTELRRDPARITSGALVAYANGSVYENRFSTADNFEFIDQTAPLANVKTAAKARAVAIRYLTDNDEEDDRITTSIIVPAAQVNAVRQGHLITFTATHLPGYTTGVAMRVLRRTVIQEVALGLDYYRIALELSPTSATAPWTCPLDSGISATAFKTYGPLGSNVTDSDGNIWYTTANALFFADGYQPTSGPRPSTASHGLGFPVYGAPNGDAGGVAVISTIRFVFAGTGTATINMTNYDGGYFVGWTQYYQATAGATPEQDALVSAPTTITVTVGALPADATSCYRWIDIVIGGQNGGSKGCFGGLTWAAL